MEVKLSQEIHLSFPPWISLKKHSKSFAEGWSFYRLEISKLKGHFVKDAELNWISRQHVHSVVAADKNISDVKFRHKGQLPKIPDFVPEDTTLLYRIKKTGHSSFYQKEKSPNSMAFLDKFLNQKPFSMLTALDLPPAFTLNCRAKFTGYFLVMLPLVAFCVTCILGAFLTKVPRDMENQAVDKSRKNHAVRKSMRWKNALNDLKDPDNPDSELKTEFKNTLEEDETVNEDVAHAYEKLQEDYQKFLSECGMSKSGYWRGGLHK